MEFENKTLLVTGAASGMGLLSAQCFSAEGANVVLVDINGEEVEKQARLINEAGGHAIGVQCDVRDYKQVSAACAKAVETFGGIDILENCAGGSAVRILKSKARTFFETPIEVYDWGIDVNLKGAFYFCHAAMKYMAEQKSGVIVNFGSITGEEGSPLHADYAASKSALMNGFIKSLAQAGAPYNIRAVCVAPGPVLTRPAMAKMKTLLGRAAEPQEIVNAVMFLASDKSAFTTGVTLLVDGGRSVMFNKE